MRPQQPGQAFHCIASVVWHGYVLREKQQGHFPVSELVFMNPFLHDLYELAIFDRQAHIVVLLSYAVDIFCCILGITGFGETFKEVDCVGKCDYLILRSFVHSSASYAGCVIEGNQVVGGSHVYVSICHETGSLCLNLDGSIFKV